MYWNRLRQMSGRTGTRAALVALVAGLPMTLGASAAFADTPLLRVDSVTNTTAPPGGALQYRLQVTNLGTAPTDGSEIDVVATLPAGVVGDSVNGGSSFTCIGLDGGNPVPVAGASVVKCTSTAVIGEHEAFPFDFPFDFRKFFINATVAPSASGVRTASFALSGGGADPASTVDPVDITPTAPGFGVDTFDGQITSDPASDPYTQAAGHPYEATTDIDFNSTTNPGLAPGIGGSLWPVEPTRDVMADLPPGFVGNPTTVDKCTAGQLANGSVQALALCPSTSQVGTALVRTNGGGVFGSHDIFGPVPVFAMVPPPDVPARFGFNVGGTIVTLDARLRSGSDYGLSVDARNISEGLAVAGTSLTFWGVPADPSHDPDRACPGRPAPSDQGPFCTSGAPQKAFLRNPTSCTAAPGSPVSDGLLTFLHVDSWVNPGRLAGDGSPDLSDPNWKSAQFASHLAPSYPATPAGWGPNQLPTGCDKVPFDPTLTAAPSSPVRAASPSGFVFDVNLPQSDDPQAIGEADLKKAVATLPLGVRISPSAADGLQACSPSQIGLHTTADPSCPEGSKVGSVVITTPLLDHQLTGSVYLATPHDNPFDSLVAVYVVAKGPGLVLKLPGEVDADPSTGQLTATFDNNPQLPFTNFHLEFKGGSRAPLVTPDACGTHATHAVLTSWSGATVSSNSSFTVAANSAGSACSPQGFSPSLEAGVQNPVAGSSSTFVLRLARDDDDEEIQSVATRLPAGLLAKLAGVTRCSDAQAAGGVCPAASRIGGVSVRVGAGPSPFSITSGQVFLTDGYKGAPFGLDITVPAVAGPFDLGVVNTRAALRIDPITAQATVEADPLPRMLEGIPVLARDIQVSIDRDGFMRSPTNCSPMTIEATVASFEGSTANLSNRFQVGDCASLALAPKLAIALTGKGQTTDDKHPAVVASLTQPAGQANLKKVTVSLPLSLALDPDNANGLCEFTDGSKIEPTCPKASIVGTATARTPILDQPLTGPVYFVKNVRKDPKSGREIRTLPKLVIPLTGENGVRLNVTGTSNVVGGRLVTTFDNLPDAPVSSFTLNIAGGKHGILVVSGTDICKATQVADQQIDGQNGKTADAAVTLATPACGLKVLSKKVGKRSVTLKVSGLGAGKLTVSGKGIKKTSRAIKAATVATVTARRTGHGRPSGVRVSFTPRGSHKAVATTVSLRSAGTGHAKIKESK